MSNSTDNNIVDLFPDREGGKAHVHLEAGGEYKKPMLAVIRELGPKKFEQQAMQHMSSPAILHISLPAETIRSLSVVGVPHGKSAAECARDCLIAHFNGRPLSGEGQ